VHGILETPCIQNVYCYDVLRITSGKKILRGATMMLSECVTPSVQRL
jgi:hypothetical protein